MCDELVEIPELLEHQRASCPNCTTVLKVHCALNYEQRFCLSLTALILMITALPFQFIKFSAHGNESILTLIDSFRGVMHYDHPLLALTVFLAVMAVPTLTVGSAVMVFGILWLNRLSRLFPFFFKILDFSKSWMMVEVFVIGVLVSLLKISSLATVDLGFSFYVFCLFVIFITALLTRFDADALWDSWESIRESNSNRGDAL